MSDTHDTPADVPPGDFRLGEVRVRPDRLLVEHGEGTVRVEPRVMEMLVLLATRGGRTVSRDELRERLWDAYVTDDAIHRAVFKLRRALGPHAELIETVPKRGYRTTVSTQWSLAGGDDTPLEAPQLSTGSPPAPRSRSATFLAFALLAVVAIVVALWARGRPVGESAERTAPAAGTAPGSDAAMEFAPFTAMSGYETHPSIESGGGAVVFANFAKEGDDALQWDLWRQPVDRGEARRLTATPEHEINPAVSPSGRRIAYARMFEGRCEVIVWDLESDHEKSVAGGCGASRGPMDCCTEVAWRDEQHLLVARRDEADDPSRIYEVEWDSGAQRLLTDPPAQWYGDTAMAISHDRERLAVVRRRAPEIADLFLLGLADGTMRQLTADGYPIRGATWSADDRTIVFARNVTGTTSLWRLDLQDGTALPLPTIGMNASAPAAGAGVLLYEEWKSEINVWQLDLGDGEAVPVVTSTRWDWRAQPSPDGSRLAFVSNRAGAAELWIADADGGNERRLTALESAIASQPMWAPDGSRIVVAAPLAGSLDIVSVDPVSGAVEPLVTDASDDREPVFCADGAHLFFASNRSGDWEIWRLQLDDGTVERWTEGGGAAARPVAGGPGVWYVRPGVPGLWRQSGAAQPAELIDTGFQPSAPSDWVVHDEGIYYLRLDDGNTAWLTRFDPASGAHRDVTVVEGQRGIAELFTGSGLWISPDGRRALVASVDLSHSDLWIGRPR